MLEMAAPAPWSTQEDMSLNTFVPSFHGFAYITSVCNDLMASTYRFTRAHPQWIPRMSDIYVAMLFYFRILDVMVESGKNEEPYRSLHKEIKKSYDFRRLRIPGPLVPYFQALSLCSSGDDLLGDVLPVIPQEVPANSETFWKIEGDSSPSLPNILALLDYPTWAIQHAAFDDADERFMSHSLNSLHSVDVNANNNADIITAVRGPGFLTKQFDVPETLNLFRTHARARLRLPQRIDQAAVEAASPHHVPTWKQFLRLQRLPSEPARSNFTTWFSSLASMMSDYSDYFSQSTSLAEIPPSSGASPHIVLLYEPATPDAITPAALPTYVPAVADPDEPANDRPARINLQILSSLAVTGKLATKGVPTPQIQMATIAHVNARIPENVDTDFEGEFWTAHRWREILTKFDYLRNAPTYVATFHSDTSIRRLT